MTEVSLARMPRIGRSVAILALILVACLAQLLSADSAAAWQIWKANPTSYGSYIIRTNHPDASGNLAADTGGRIPQGATLYSTGATWTGYSKWSGGTETWLEVIYGGKRGWSIHKAVGYGYSFTNQGTFTAKPWTTLSSPDNDSSTNSRRPPLRWTQGDPDGNGANAAEIQIATDPAFTKLLRNGGTTLGAYDPNWDMAPGQYWWRARTHSWINYWGAWSSSRSFIVRHPTKTVASASTITPLTGNKASISFKGEKWLDGALKGSVSSMPLTISQSSDGVNWKTVAAVNTDSTGVYQFTTPVFSSDAKQYYMGSLGTTKWTAGSASPVITLSPRYKTRTLISASSLVPTVGRTMSLTFKTQKLAGTSYVAAAATPIKIQKSTDGTNWTDVASVQTDSSGLYQHSTSLTRRTYFKAIAASTANSTASTSVPVEIKPRPVVSRPTAPKKATEGVAFSVKGTLKPRHQSGTYPVRIRAYYYSFAKSKWVYHSTFKAKAYNVSTYSGYVGRFKAPAGNRYWAFRAYAPADSRHSASKLSSYSVSPFTWVP